MSDLPLTISAKTQSATTSRSAHDRLLYGDGGYLTISWILEIDIQ